MMNRVKILSIAMIAVGTAVNAQDLDQAKKAIDAEQYDNAKKMLKSLVVSSPDEGKVSFILGNLYMTQKHADSAAMSYQKGLTAKNNAKINYIGMGQIDLEKGNEPSATANFVKATEDMRKKDFEEFMYIGRAYLNSTKPNPKKALEYLNKAKALQPNNAEVLVSLGDAFYADKNVNEAYSAYRNAADADKNQLRARLQRGVITKNSKAFAEAKAEFEGILRDNPNYGPAYRELAETYYLWALNTPAKYEEYNRTAMTHYEKYMSMTDYSLESRMRHADFLVLTKDYKALEAEALEMQKLDKVNPRILRYLGYAAYENGNPDATIEALNKFIATPNAKLIGRDYLYLGLAKTAKALTGAPAATSTDAKATPTATVDATVFDSGVADIRKGVEMDPAMANELNDIGKKFFDLKLYREAASIYEVAVTVPEARNYLYDNFYLGYALYFHNANKDVKDMDVEQLKKAAVAFGKVSEASPTTQDAYLYRARVNSLLESDPEAQADMVKAYEDYIKVVTEKGEAEVSKPANQTKFVEAYNNMAIYFAKSEPAKARDYFQKVLTIDPANETALSTMKLLKG
jgi:tetratricopeptide (TPR) repeat protein